MIARIFTLLFFVTAVACSCHKEPCKEVQPQIEGVWKQTSIPHSVYSFSDGLCIQRIQASGQEVWRNEFSYTTKRDTVCMTNVESGGKRTWIVDFPDEYTMHVNATEALISIELKRMR